ncbi:5-formyltetrahydrofolate cyclo-ligase [Candidatus Woesearchaeota archaeon]|nr:5-formyltetrahydrofolate cyclo-ligase [Candidatus Woesearchaeota archaeon]
MGKEAIRKKLQEMRIGIDEEFVREKSKEIMKKLFEDEDYKKAKTVMFYVSIDDEVDTHDMIHEALKEKKVCVPKTNLATKTIDAHHIESFNHLRVGSFYILEPENESKVDVSDIDVIIVPGVAFDKKGNRIGRGKGYYDKFLKDKHSKKIGLAFGFQILDEVPVEEHDVAVDKVIS